MVLYLFLYIELYGIQCNDMFIAKYNICRLEIKAKFKRGFFLMKILNVKACFLLSKFHCLFFLSNISGNYINLFTN